MVQLCMAIVRRVVVHCTRHMGLALRIYHCGVDSGAHGVLHPVCNSCNLFDDHIQTHYPPPKDRVAGYALLNNVFEYNYHM